MKRGGKPSSAAAFRIRPSAAATSFRRIRIQERRFRALLQFLPGLDRALRLALPAPVFPANPVERFTGAETLGGFLQQVLPPVPARADRLRELLCPPVGPEKRRMLTLRPLEFLRQPPPVVTDAFHDGSVPGHEERLKSGLSGLRPERLPVLDHRAYAVSRFQPLLDRVAGKGHFRTDFGLMGQVCPFEKFVREKGPRFARGQPGRIVTGFFDRAGPGKAPEILADDMQPIDRPLQLAAFDECIGEDGGAVRFQFFDPFHQPVMARHGQWMATHAFRRLPRAQASRTRSWPPFRRGRRHPKSG